jgi:hypothetical protein
MQPRTKYRRCWGSSSWLDIILQSRNQNTAKRGKTDLVGTIYSHSSWTCPLIIGYRVIHWHLQIWAARNIVHLLCFTTALFNYVIVQPFLPQGPDRAMLRLTAHMLHNPGTYSSIVPSLNLPSYHSGRHPHHIPACCSAPALRCRIQPL